MVCLMLSFQLEGEKRKDHSSAHSKEHYYQCERDFDVHSCNKIIISFLHCPHHSYSVHRETCQEVMRWPLRSSSLLQQNSPVFTHTERHLTLRGGIFLKIHTLQNREVECWFFFFCISVFLFVLFYFILQINFHSNLFYRLTLEWLSIQQRQQFEKCDTWKSILLRNQPPLLSYSKGKIMVLVWLNKSLLQPQEVLIQDRRCSS